MVGEIKRNEELQRAEDAKLAKNENMICPQVTLDIALTDKAISIQSIASVHKISRQHVRRCFGAVALALCTKQAAFVCNAELVEACWTGTSCDI